VTVKEYREEMASSAVRRGLMNTYVRGLAEGIQWANADATNEKKNLYCEPDIVLGVETYIDILDRTIKERSDHSDYDKMPIGLLLLHGLRATFPCTDKK
jgi:hypothetical protein